MSITVNGESIYSAADLYKECNSDTLQKYVHELTDTRFSFDQLPHPEKKTIGTIDATSCIGILYRTSGGNMYVQHHDGRNLNELSTIFHEDSFKGSAPVEVTLIGGCREPNRHGEFEHSYDLLQKDTKKNIETLVKRWEASAYNLVIRGWAIGDSKDYASLCPDFVADSEGIYLTQPGAVIEKNAELNEKLIPELPRRFAAMLSLGKYHCVYKSGSTLQLPGLPNASTWSTALNRLPNIIRACGDDNELLLMRTSTTPKMEPPYYCKNLRGMAKFLKDSETTRIEDCEVSIMEGQPVIGLQGEVVSLLSD